MRTYLDGPLELLAAVLVIVAAVVLGVVFHRLALSVLLGLVAAAALAVYFANAYQDVRVDIKLPKLRRLKKVEIPEAKPGEVVHFCAVCGKDSSANHKNCNRVVAMSAAAARRPRDP